MKVEGIGATGGGGAGARAPPSVRKGGDAPLEGGRRGGRGLGTWRGINCQINKS